MVQGLSSPLLQPFPLTLRPLVREMAGTSPCASVPVPLAWLPHPPLLGFPPQRQSGSLHLPAENGSTSSPPDGFLELVGPQLGPTLYGEDRESSSVPLPVSRWWLHHKATTRLVCVPWELSSLKETSRGELPSLCPLPSCLSPGSTAPFSAAKGFQVLGNQTTKQTK